MDVKGERQLENDGVVAGQRLAVFILMHKRLHQIEGQAYLFSDEPALTRIYNFCTHLTVFQAEVLIYQTCGSRQCSEHKDNKQVVGFRSIYIGSQERDAGLSDFNPSTFE